MDLFVEICIVYVVFDYVLEIVLLIVIYVNFCMVIDVFDRVSFVVIIDMSV